MFLIITFLTLLAVVSSTTSNSFTLPKHLTGKTVFPNKKWVSVSPAVSKDNKLVRNLSSSKGGASVTDSTVEASDIKTFLLYEYLGNSECLGTTAIGIGYTYNTCLTGYDDKGNAIGSGIFRVSSVNLAMTHSVYSEYTSSDCSGQETYKQETDYPSFCVADDTNTASFRFQFTNSTDVANSFKNGLLFS
jgi:hypothetical protein